MYFHRSIEGPLREAIAQFPVCLITGPRQAGKSTLLQNTLKEYRYVSFDDPMMQSLARNDPELFLSRFPSPLIIDEIQYVPGLLPYLKMKVDAHRRTYGQYVLTGSQSFQMMKGVSETLAGRIAIFNLYPLSWKEIAKIPSFNKEKSGDLELARQIIRGFYPEFFINPTIDCNVWFGSYLSTYIERDVRNVKGIADLARFQTFIGLLAARAGQLLNLSEIAKECGITQPTAKDWLSVLEATYFIYILRSYHKNMTKRLVKTPKLFFVDTGLLCYLLGIDTEERFFKSKERGALFENMIVMEMIKQLSCQKIRSQFYFYRTASGTEVDLLVEKQEKIDAYEIKLSKTLNQKMGKSLEALMEDMPVSTAQVLSLHEDPFPLSKNVEAVHWSTLFY